MALKQISVTMPANLFEASREYAEEYGYKNVQEFILDSIRRKLLSRRIERYEAIEREIDRNAGAMSQEEAVRYLEGI
jgi:metal-responsive CopG/Arc/MetJ family transcriptional regulator